MRKSAVLFAKPNRTLTELFGIRKQQAHFSEMSETKVFRAFGDLLYALGYSVSEAVHAYYHDLPQEYFEVRWQVFKS